MPIDLSELESWEEIIKEVDIDGDGEISCEEFVVMMEKFFHIS